jgi:hypothetical protein
MKTVRMSGIVWVLGLTLAACLIVSSSVRAEAAAEAKEHHPRIHEALQELAAAKVELEKADHDLGGHRADAVKAVERATRQLEKALEFAKGADASSVKTIADTPKAEADVKHPHIHAALTALRDTRKELKDAAHDFGGHRADALEAVDHAIKELKAALEFDKK